ncbi:MAG TPA: hypothetical protein VIJ37_00680 [Steroidobacteraceae bacterium]
MILSLSLPRVGESTGHATVHRLLARTGDVLRPGTALLEVRVDLGAAKAQDCPPLFYFRIIATEHAHLRALQVSPGEALEVGRSFGVATTEMSESFAEPAIRKLRTTSVAIQVDPLAAKTP